MARKISVEIVGNAASLERSFAKARGSAAGFDSSLGRLSIGFGQLLKGIVVVDAVQAAFRGLSDTVHLGVAEFSEHAHVSAQTAAALKSTGGIANITAAQIDGLGLSLSNLSGVDDEVVQSGANVLLAFQNIRNFAGKNNDIFTQATKATVDFAVRSGRSVPAAAVAIGRALQDPAKAAGSLRRAYVVLTVAEKAAIASAVRHGDMLKAQQLIIGDLNKRYGGAAKAVGQTLPGQLNVLRDRFKDLAGELVGLVAPATAKAVTGLTAFVKVLSETQGTRAKIAVIWTGIESAAKGAQAALRRAVAAVDWNAVWAGARGIADGLTTRLQSVDWTKVGTAIGTGIARSIAVAASATKQIAEKLQNVIGAIDFVKIGKAAGPGLAAALVTAFATLTDPTFWVKNWDLALAVGLVAFGGPLGKLGGKLLVPFSRLGVRLGEGLALSMSGAIERLGGKLAGAGGSLVSAAGRLIERFAGVVLAGFLRLPGLVGRALAPLTGAVSRAFGRLGRLTRFAIKVTGIDVAINTITSAFGQLAAIIGHSLDGAWQTLENAAKRAGLKTAIAIVDPLSSIPKVLGGGTFQGLKASLQKELDGLPSVAERSAGGIQSAFAAAFGTIATLTNAIASAKAAAAPDQQALNKASAFAQASPTAGLPEPPVPTGLKRKGITAGQRNTFFDNAISSDLSRAGFVPSIKGQIAALQNIAGLISARIAATKDVTRRRTLEDQLLGIESQITGDRQQVAQSFLDALSFKVTKAQATASFKDDIAALNALKAGIQAQIKATGETLALEQQLFDVQGQIQAARNTQRNAGQFKALGLTATGDDVTPSVKHLKAELAKVGDALKGTFLDTTKTQSIISGIRRVLSGGLGAVGKDVRAKVQEILAGLDQQLKNHAGNQTKFRHVASDALLAGLGLTPDQLRLLRSRVAQIGAGGSIPSRGPAFAGAGATRSLGVTQTFTGPINNYGITDVKAMDAALKKRAGRRSGSRRGPNAGH